MDGIPWAFQLPDRRSSESEPRMRAPSDRLPSDQMPSGHSRAAAQAWLFYRLIGRPLLDEPARTLITTLCVAIGVAVVVAIDLAGDASAGSFRSSMESLQGDASYEITQVGGIPDAVFGELVRLRAPIDFTAQVSGYATVAASGERVPLFGVDLIGSATRGGGVDVPLVDLDVLVQSRPVWVSPSLDLVAGEEIDLVINDRLESFVVQGALADSDGTAGLDAGILVMDVALAQRVLDRQGRLDRIYARVSGNEEGDFEALIAEHLPPGASIRAAGVRTRESRKLLRSFRWNLQVLSYIALIVGAFLVYNTVSVSVVRRRPLIGVARALGMPARWIRAGFLLEGACLGVVGTLAGLALGRLLAGAAVELMGRTVQSLYVSSAPGEIEIGPGTALAAAFAGLGVSCASAWWPAREASSVPPTEAIARARRDYEIGVGQRSWTGLALLCAAASTAMCLVPAWDRVPFGGFLAAIGFILSSSLLVPQVASLTFRRAARPLSRLLGAAGMIGSRSLAGSLGRTSVIVGALATATAMMVSVAIMVGSLRETLLVWMDSQLQADLYIQAEASTGPDDAATFDEDVARVVEGLAAVDAVDRFRRYSISYDGLPAILALADFRVHRTRSRMRFLEGPDIETLVDRLTSSDSVIVSEAFANKHGVGRGDPLELPVGGRGRTFEIAAVYADYSAEQGYVIGHREILMRDLPDERLTSLAVYLKAGTETDAGRREIIDAVGGRRLRVARNRDLRENAVAIFDRTFAITYALEAIAVFVAILGMAGALVTLVFDRRVELGVLRALGATRRQVRRMVLVQAGLLGLLSTAMGVALGAALSVVLIKVINKQSFGWTIQFHWPVGLLLAAIATILATAVLAGIFPARTAASAEPADSMQRA